MSGSCASIAGGAGFLVPVLRVSAGLDIWFLRLKRADGAGLCSPLRLNRRRGLKCASSVGGAGFLAPVLRVLAGLDVWPL